MTLETLKALFFGGANWAQRNTSDHETMDLILDQFRHTPYDDAAQHWKHNSNCSTCDAAARAVSAAARAVSDATVRWNTRRNRWPRGLKRRPAVVSSQWRTVWRAGTTCSRGTIRCSMRSRYALHCTAHTAERIDPMPQPRARSAHAHPQQALSDCCPRCMLYAVCVAQCLVCVARLSE